MSDKFVVRWQVEDGYIGHGTHSTYADGFDVQSDMTDEDLSALYDDIIQDDFDRRVGARGVNREEFIKWAREQIAKRGDE